MNNMDGAFAGSQLGLWSDLGAIPLQRVDVNVTLAFPVSQTTVTQYYRSSHEAPIEARYVFPVPFHAVLLGLKLKLGDDVIEGVVTPNADAEATYEQAISQGDSALLVRRLTDCLYAVQVGNLMPDETLRVEITWAEPLNVSGTGVSYRLPTVVGPHYGDPMRQGLHPTDVPSISETVAYELTFSAQLTGELSGAKVTSQTHTLEVTSAPNLTVVHLAEDAWLDHALTLDIELQSLPRASAWATPDGDGTVVLASVVPTSTSFRYSPRHLTVVIDASGSMEGESIAQAREAVEKTLDRLAPDDTIYILAFGNTTEAITPERQCVKSLSPSTRYAVKSLEANLGGTELAAALIEAAKQTPETGDILLITDGQCYMSDIERRRLLRPGLRYFTVGVGRDASEQVLRRLALESQGSCCFVTPDEDMTLRIGQHVSRLLSHPMEHRWSWPVSPARQRNPAIAFAGDMTLSYARFDEQLEHSALSVMLDGESTPVALSQAPEWLRSVLPRFVAHALLPEHNLKARRREAVHYQLVTDQTSMVAVKNRALAKETITAPVIVEVPQMLMMRTANAARAGRSMMRVSASNISYELKEDAYAELDKPAYLRHQPPKNSQLSRSLALEHAFWDELASELASGVPLLSCLLIEKLPQKMREEARKVMSQRVEHQFMRELLAESFKLLPILRRLRLRKVWKVLKSQEERV